MLLLLLDLGDFSLVDVIYHLVDFAGKRFRWRSAASLAVGACVENRHLDRLPVEALRLCLQLEHVCVVQRAMAVRCAAAQGTHGLDCAANTRTRASDHRRRRHPGRRRHGYRMPCFQTPFLSLPRLAWRVVRRRLRAGLRPAAQLRAGRSFESPAPHSVTRLALARRSNSTHLPCCRRCRCCQSCRDPSSSCSRPAVMSLTHVRTTNQHHCCHDRGAPPLKCCCYAASLTAAQKYAKAEV
jgi:hypothetical protein